MLGLFGDTKRDTINGFFKRKKVDISQSNRWTSANQIAAVYPRVRKRDFLWHKNSIFSLMQARKGQNAMNYRFCTLLCVAVCWCMLLYVWCTFFYVAVRYLMLRYLAVLLLLYVDVFFYVAVPCCTVVVQKAQAGRKGLNSAWLLWPKFYCGCFNSVRWLIVSCCTLL